jgi:hypothetical protein
VIGHFSATAPTGKFYKLLAPQKGQWADALVCFSPLFSFPPLTLLPTQVCEAATLEDPEGCFNLNLVRKVNSLGKHVNRPCSDAAPFGSTTVIIKGAKSIYTTSKPTEGDKENKDPMLGAAVPGVDTDATVQQFWSCIFFCLFSSF